MITIHFYIICFNPSDYPGMYVLRERSISDGEQPVLHGCIISNSLEFLRECLPPGLTRIGRFENDDPVIVETWL